METKLTLKQMALIASLMISGNLVQAMGHPFNLEFSEIKAPATSKVEGDKVNKFVAVTAGLGSIVAAGTPAAVAVITDGGKAVTNVASKAVTNAVAPRTFGLFKNPFMAASTKQVVVPQAFGLFKNPFVKSVDNIVVPVTTSANIVAPVTTYANAVSQCASSIVNKGCELGQTGLEGLKAAGNAGFAIVKNHPKIALGVAITTAGVLGLGYAYKYAKNFDAAIAQYHNLLSKQQLALANKASDIVINRIDAMTGSENANVTTTENSVQVTKFRIEFLKELKHGFEECYKADMELLKLIKDGTAQVTNEMKSAFESIKISDYLGSTDPLAKDLELKRYRMGIWFNSVAKNVTKIDSLYAGSWKLFLKVLDSAILAAEAATVHKENDNNVNYNNVTA